VYESESDERSEKILLCIEKQALVQTIIREFAKHLVPEKYISITSVSALLPELCPDFFTSPRICVLHFVGWELM